jgi:hypothetical protein
MVRDKCTADASLRASDRLLGSNPDLEESEWSRGECSSKKRVGDNST